MCAKKNKLKHQKNKDKSVNVSYSPACFECGWTWTATLDDFDGANVFRRSLDDVGLLMNIIHFKTGKYIWSIKGWTFLFNQSFSSWICAGKRLMKFDAHESFYFVSNNVLIHYIYLHLTNLPNSLVNLVVQYLPVILLQLESDNYFMSIDEFNSSTSFILRPKHYQLPSIYPQRFGYGCRCDETI